MKKVYLIILLFLFAGTTKVFATHIMGMDLSYTCTGNNKYTFTLNFYRDCAGITVQVKKLHLVSKSNNYSATVPFTEVGSAQNISLVCPSDVNKTTCNGGTITGTQKWVFTATVTLPYYAKDWVFYYDDYARNDAITNLVNPGNDGIRVVDSLDNSSGACVNSPIFTTLPTPYVCNMIQTHYNHGGYDPDGDSMSYQLVAPLDSFGNPVKYVTGFSYTNPLTLDSASFEFNQQSGQMTFTPSGTQITVTAVRVYAYNSSGKIIGYVTRDIEIIVLNCSDESPTESWFYNLSGCYATSNVVTGCVGEPLSFTIHGTDVNAADSVYMSTNLGTVLPNAIFTTTPGFPNATGTVTWTPTLADTGTHYFTSTVKDNYCPIFNEQVYTYGITISRGVHGTGGALICKGTSKQLEVYGGTGSYTWTPATGLSCTACSNPIATPSFTTTYIVTGTTSPLVCKTSDTVIVSVDTFQTHASPHSAGICTGNNIQLTASNGSNFTWSPATGLTCTSCTNPTANPTSSTNYILTASDGNGCVTHDTAKITVNPLPSVAATANKPLICYNSVDTLKASGAVTYTWSPSASLSSSTGSSVIASPLVTTTYTVTGTNINGCVNTGTVTVDCNPKINLTISAQTNVLCYGSNTGSATVSATGGTSPYTYAWNTSPTQTAATATGLTAGTYTVTVTDHNNCSAQATVIITQPQSAVSASISTQTNVLCYANNSGAATASASGGTGSYTYVWNTTPVQKTATATGLTAGTYTVSITDANGCSTTATAVITQPAAALSASVSSQTNVLCFANNSGSATAKAAGGTGNYTYSWNTTPAQTSATATGLTAGTYTVSITDANGCSTTASAIITQPTAAISASISSQINELCYGNNTGSATVSGSGGTGAYTYSWNTTPAQTAATATGLTAGTYTATVTDHNGCSTTASVVISQPTATVSASISAQTNVLCYGNNTGSATSKATGGAGNYSYSWNTTPAQASATATGLVAGTYTVTITDANGCSSFASAVISQPTASVNVSISAQTNVSCFGNSSGSATATVNGGTGNYTYSWNTTPAQTAATATGLVAGTYTVSITDANGCSTSASAVISQPQAALNASVNTQVNVSCFGNNTGSATASVSGGTQNYTYSWNTIPAQTSATATGLVAGTYTVSITDANGCSTSASAVISQPQAALNASVNTQVNVSCFGNNTGSATASVSGGTQNYTYSWNTTPAQTSATATGLVAGTYTVSITDANGCSTSASAVISQPQAALNVSVNAQINVSCFGNNTGSATASVSGGTQNYTYSWNTTPAQTSATATGLVAGTYTVSITDANGCSTSASAVISQPKAALNASVNTQVNVSCFGNNTGSATASVSGGTQNYTYSWNTTPAQTSATATGLVAGTYTVSITDANGCSTSASAVISQPKAALTSSITSQSNVSCFGGAGTASVTANGGTQPYTYSWNTSPSQSTDTANNLSAGTYTVTVTDVNGCSTSATAIISQPAGALSASVNSQSNVLCYGGNNGSATVTAIAGTAPYTYSWNTTPAQTTATATGLSAGMYTVTVTDSGGCMTTAGALIAQPTAALNASVSSQIPASCFGNNNGSASVSVSGGTPSYSYSWNTIPVQATATATGLTAGTYTVSITDTNGCATSATVIISQPQAALNASISSQIPVSCFGNSTGSATVSVNGGTPSYTYSWNTTPAQTTATATGLATGTYTVSVTDTNGCTTSATVTISQPQAALSASISSQIPVSCFGNNTGSATVSVSGGTPSYTYSWNTTPAQTTATATGLTAGTYTVSVTDTNGCSTTSTVTITQPQATLSASISTQIAASCFGNSNGSATVSVNGGTPSYTYSWNTTPAQTTATATGLAAGTYTVSVTDTNGCATTATAIISQPQAVLSASISTQIPVSCFGNSTGTATASVSGGTPSYTYSWNTTPAQTAATATGLAAGTYTVTVTDTNGCSTTATAVISQPQAALSASVSSQIPVSCFGNNNGSATASVSGGTPSYTYSWNTIPVQTTATATGLPAGTYTVSITDTNGCATSATVVISQPLAALSASVSSQVNVSCFGGNGSATTSVSGGTTPYTYSWNTQPAQTSATATGLAAGTYTVSIIDSNGCTTTASVVITQPLGALNASVSAQTNVLCYGNNSGSAIVTATAGTQPYTYSWNTAPAQTTATATGLTAGTYTVTVMDSGGCITTANVVISQPQAALSTAVSASSSTICNNSPTTISALTSGGTAQYSYSWTPGGATTDTITVDPSVATTYTVTVTDASGCSTTDSIIINVNQLPIISVTANSGTICNGAADTLTASGATSYTWTPATSLNSTSGSPVVANPSASVTYTVTGTDVNGCSNTTTATVNVNQLPTVSLNGLNPTYCANSSNVVLQGVPPAAAPVGVYLGTGTRDSADLFYPDSAGVGGPYTVTYVFTDTLTGCKNSASLPVTILGAPNVSVTPDSPTVCSGIAVTMVASGASSYNWSPSTGLSATTGSSVTSNTSSTTVYTVIGTDTDGCSSNALTTVTINTLPIVTIAPVNPNICLGDSVVLNASGGTSYTWMPAAGLSCTSCSSTTANPTSTTQYIVDVSNGKCSSNDTIKVGVYSVSVTAGTYQKIYLGNTAQLVSSGAAYYSWTPGNTLSNDSISDPIASPTVTTTYTVTGRDSLGCTATDTVVIVVINPCESLMLPSGFTPSGTTNRYFHVLNVGDATLEEFRVYDRWGEMMFETNNISDQGWDGTFNGKQEPMGTYVYYAEILCEGKTVFIKGNVTLIR